MYSLYSVFVNDADLGILGISLQTLQDLVARHGKMLVAVHLRFIYFLMSFFKNPAKQIFLQNTELKRSIIIFQTMTMGFCAPLRKFQMKEHISFQEEKPNVKGESC